MKSFYRFTAVLFFTVLTATAVFSQMKKSEFFGLKTGMERQAVEGILKAGDYGCSYASDFILCNNYNKYMMLIAFREEKVYSITLKDDIVNADETFKEKLREMQALYGKPQKLDEEKNFALFYDDKKPAALRTIDKGDSGILLYLYGEDSECEDLKEMEE